VAEQDLHDADVDTVLHQAGRVAVAKRMRRHPLPYSRRGGSGGKGARQHTIIERRVTVMIGKQPAAVVMGQPQVAKVVEHRFWQRHQPLLVALTDDAQHLIGTVDGADLQRGRLADAQAAGIDNSKTCLVDRVADAAEQVSNLVFRQRVRQPLLPWRSDPFFPRTIPTLG